MFVKEKEEIQEDKYEEVERSRRTVVESVDKRAGRRKLVFGASGSEKECFYQGGRSKYVFYAGKFKPGVQSKFKSKINKPRLLQPRWGMPWRQSKRLWKPRQQGLRSSFMPEWQSLPRWRTFGKPRRQSQRSKVSSFFPIRVPERPTFKFYSANATEHGVQFGRGPPVRTPMEGKRMVAKECSKGSFEFDQNRGTGRVRMSTTGAFLPGKEVTAENLQS